MHHRRVPRLSLAVALFLAFAGPALAQNNQDSLSIDGSWLGALDAGGVKLRLVMKFSRTPDGQLKGAVDSIDQGVNNINVSMVTFHDGLLHVEMASLSAAYDGKMSQDGESISGTFVQGGATLPLDLKRTESGTEPKLNRPQTPKKPYPYEEVEVTYQNVPDKITLAATLTIPRGSGPFPAVVLITGSGSQDRDETILLHKPFLVLADYLTRRGIAVLRADDRGIGGTTKGTENDTTENFVGDALAGVEFLKSRKEISPKLIGLIGHSEGGMIAPMAAVRSADVAFIVLMAGPGIRGDKLLAMQSGLVSAAECRTAANEEAAAAERLFAMIASEKDPAVAKQKVVAEEAKRADQARRRLDAELKVADARITQLISPWFQFFLRYDPRPTITKVRVPVLALNGSNDVQVPPQKDLEAIEQALKAGGNHDYKIVLLPKLNHLFQTSETGGPSEYSRIEETIAPAALQAIGDWIEAHTRAGAAKQ